MAMFASGACLSGAGATESRGWAGVREAGSLKFKPAKQARCALVQLHAMPAETKIEAPET
jgi:hypothetical protein